MFTITTARATSGPLPAFDRIVPGHQYSIEGQPYTAAEVRAWLEVHMKGSENLRWSGIWSTVHDDAEYGFRRRLGEKLGRKGWLFPTFPKEYGGAGLSSEHRDVLEVELDRWGLPLELVFYTTAKLVAPAVLLFGTEEQKREFLPPMMRGDVAVWQTLTEPQGGSDIATCRTKAVRDGDDYVIDGQKIMVGHHMPPDWLWVLVNTNPEGKRHENLSWVYIRADTPGISTTQLNLMMGVKNAVYFDHVRVPAKSLIGGENNGWKVADAYLILEHGGGGSVAESALLAHVIEHCEQMQPDGTRMIDDIDVRDQIADMILDVDTERLMGLRNLWHYTAKETQSYAGSQYRYFQRVLGLRNAERLQKILGYDALVPVKTRHELADFEYNVRSGPGRLHGGGTLHTDRLIIARRLGLGRNVDKR